MECELDLFLQPRICCEAEIIRELKSLLSGENQGVAIAFRVCGAVGVHERRGANRGMWGGKGGGAQSRSGWGIFPAGRFRLLFFLHQKKSNKSESEKKS